MPGACSPFVISGCLRAYGEFWFCNWRKMGNNKEKQNKVVEIFVYVVKND